MLSNSLKSNLKNPIGIFDSGLGGLTVVHAVSSILPNENIYYFGDTAHSPWGTKSSFAIKNYAKIICKLLISEFNCKAIVVACNTAAAIAMDVIKETINDSNKNIILINVIDPIVEYVKNNFVDDKIGIIGTKQTINSKTYQNKINALLPNVKVSSLATPLLVPLIEEGFIEKKATKLILEEYLLMKNLQGIVALILACTHYPLIKNLIVDFYKSNTKDNCNGNIKIIDSANLTAEKLLSSLQEKKLLNENNLDVQRKFYVTDYNDFFASTASSFFQEEIKLKSYPIWNKEVF